MGIIKRISVTRVSRLKQYLDQLKEDIPIRQEKDKKRIRSLRRKIKRTFIKMRVFSWTRGLFYVVLYASIVSNFLGDFATPEAKFIGRFAQPFIILSSIIGTTISLFLVLIFTKVLNTYWEDARTYATHLIAIYIRNDTVPSKKLDSFLAENE
ncbi:MAG: hypothetical protein ABIJ21_03105 [Nanoarchaeota archaeon]